MSLSSNSFSSPKILAGKVNFPLCLAPMVGLSHVALRRVLREYLPHGARTLWPTEMLNSRRLPFENLNTTPETLRHASESELIPQILGNEEKSISASVRRLEIEWGASGIDINMGCPVQKALKHNYGVSLMGDSDYAAEVVRMAVRSTSLPVSVKLRALSRGDEGEESIQNFVLKLQDAGASWICLHPRVAELQRRGQADWQQIRWVKKCLNIGVVGNGDIQVAEDVFQMLEKTNCDLVMSGRALAARPWMLWQVGERLGMSAPIGREGKRAPQKPLEEGAEYGRSFLRLIDFCEESFAEPLALRKLRFYVRTTHVWLTFGLAFVSETCRAQNLQELRQRTRKFFDQPQEMRPRTELRQ